MQAVFPAWDALVPVASDRHNILAVLIAMAMARSAPGHSIAEKATALGLPS
jgi:hypothetical protein